jgi:hypothetical protein
VPNELRAQRKHTNDSFFALGQLRKSVGFTFVMIVRMAALVALEKGADEPALR